MGILDTPSIEGTYALGAITSKYFCSLAAKYSDSHPYIKRIAERCKNGKEGDIKGSDSKDHSGSGTGESESSGGAGTGQ